MIQCSGMIGFLFFRVLCWAISKIRQDDINVDIWYESLVSCLQNDLLSVQPKGRPLRTTLLCSLHKSIDITSTEQCGIGWAERPKWVKWRGRRRWRSVSPQRTCWPLFRQIFVLRLQQNPLKSSRARCLFRTPVWGLTSPIKPRGRMNFQYVHYKWFHDSLVMHFVPSVQHIFAKTAMWSSVCIF